MMKHWVKIYEEYVLNSGDFAVGVPYWQLFAGSLYSLSVCRMLSITAYFWTSTKHISRCGQAGTPMARNVFNDIVYRVSTYCNDIRSNSRTKNILWNWSTRKSKLYCLFSNVIKSSIIITEILIETLLLYAIYFQFTYRIFNRNLIVTIEYSITFICFWLKILFSIFHCMKIRHLYVYVY